MKSAIAFLLTLCLSGALVTASQPDIYEELENLKTKAEAQALAIEGLITDLNETKTDLLNYKAASKVAFSAGVIGGLGPITDESKLIYSKIITNIGMAYDYQTGVFTAPVSGVYFFRFNTMDERQNEKSGAALYKNDERVILNYAFNHHDNKNPERVSNGVVLELVQSDLVYMRLPVGYAVKDYGEHSFNTFSGFLLFPM